MNTFEEFLNDLSPRWTGLLKDLFMYYFTRSVRRLQPDDNKLIIIEYLQYVKNNDETFSDDDGMKFKIHPTVASLLLRLYEIANPHCKITVDMFDQVSKLRGIKQFSELIDFTDDVRYSIKYGINSSDGTYKKLYSHRLNSAYRKIKGTITSIKQRSEDILPFSMYITVVGGCTKELMGPATFIKYNTTSTIFYIKNLNSERELWNRTTIEVSVPIELINN